MLFLLIVVSVFTILLVRYYKSIYNYFFGNEICLIENAPSQTNINLKDDTQNNHNPDFEHYLGINNGMHFFFNRIAIMIQYKYWFCVLL